MAAAKAKAAQRAELVGNAPSATLQPKRYLARGSLNLMNAAVGLGAPQIIIKETVPVCVGIRARQIAVQSSHNTEPLRLWLIKQRFADSITMQQSHCFKSEELQ